MSKKTDKPINLKSGKVLPPGQTVKEWNVDGKQWICKLETGEKIRVISGFKKPSIKTLEKYSDGLSKSVLGNTVEPDGHDSEGSPSWLLVLGMI